MADTGLRSKQRADPIHLREAELRQAMELLFFAYRDDSLARRQSDVFSRMPFIRASGEK